MAQRILVVEDDLPMSKLIHKILTMERFEVKVAHDGHTALRTAESWNPDLVLLDVMIPGIDGYEVCRSLRQIDVTSKVPIIMLTAMATVANKAQGFAAGADGYLTKPFDNDELLLHVKAQLRRVEMLTTEDATWQGTVISVFSLRGGSGCSSLAVNLAVGLTRLWDDEVCLIDLSLPANQCDMMLNVRPVSCLSDLADWDLSAIDWSAIQECLAPHMSGVRLLAGTRSLLQGELVTNSLATHIIEKVRSHFRYVVIDTTHSFVPTTLTALDAADNVVMPITPDINSVRVARSTLDVFSELGYEEKQIDLVVNHIFNVSNLDIGRIERSIRHTVSAEIPYAPNIWSQAINTGRPAMLSLEEEPMLVPVEDLTWRISKVADRRRTPPNPTALWRRIVRRLRDRQGKD